MDKLFNYPVISLLEVKTAVKATQNVTQTAQILVKESADSFGSNVNPDGRSASSSILHLVF